MVVKLPQDGTAPVIHAPPEGFKGSMFAEGEGGFSLRRGGLQRGQWRWVNFRDGAFCGI